jgi:hypothetical protein
MSLQIDFDVIDMICVRIDPFLEKENNSVVIQTYFLFKPCGQWPQSENCKLDHAKWDADIRKITKQYGQMIVS